MSNDTREPVTFSNGVYGYAEGPNVECGSPSKQAGRRPDHKHPKPHKARTPGKGF